MTDILYKLGVYKLNCSFCKSVYRQTIRNFRIRYCEHSRNFRLKPVDIKFWQTFANKKTRFDS